ncbi:MAG: DNA primase, partial [Ghiorsea sp.]|nr:DNA primase [Ghiorsea sp.]
EQQLSNILRLHGEPVFCFDGDRAGRQAAWRAIERMLPILKTEHSPKFLYLPDGEDPDTLLQKEGKDAFEKRLKNDTKPMLTTWLQGLKNIAGSGAEGRARMAKKADQMLSNMQDDYLRQAWQVEIEKISGVMLKQTKTTQYAPKPRQGFTRIKAPRLAVRPMTHEQFMAALLQKPSRFQILPEDSFHFFIDSNPIFPIYTRAFSLAGDDENTELDIAAQLMREFPDTDIARWVNLPNIEDDVFQMLLMDMHLAYLKAQLSQTEGLSVRIKLQAEVKELQKQLKALKPTNQD